jgi:hypothetical protein
MSGQLRVETEEVKLSLRLSHGGRFGIDRKGDKLHWSSFVAAMLTTPVEVPASLALAWMSSLPVQAEASEIGRKQGLDGWVSCHQPVQAAIDYLQEFPGTPSIQPLLPPNFQCLQLD